MQGRLFWCFMLMPLFGLAQSAKSNHTFDGTEIFANRVFEKVYVQTDKPYYYPGERIWFKAYMNYFYQPARDSLSKTLYVELINASREIVLKKILRLENAFSYNDFILPDSMNEGNYYLRAYTQLQRNFGDANLFLKKLPVLSLTTKPEYTNEKEEPQSVNLQISSGKTSYRSREKITLRFAVQDAKAADAHISVSVTDGSLVLPIPEQNHIVQALPIVKEEIPEVHAFTYLAEHGITLNGQFLNTKGIGTKTMLNVIQLNPYQFGTVETDHQGYFKYWDLQLYGEGSLSIKSTTTKGKVIALKHEVPPVPATDREFNFPIIDQKTVQRLFSEYDKPGDVTLLDQVVITAQRETALEKNVNNTIGKPEYLFEEDKIKTQYPNLLYTLQSLNIAGLLVNPSTQTVYFARHMKPVLTAGVNAEEVAKSYTPLVVLDGAPLVGSAGEALMTINPTSVASIEVTRSQSSIYGTRAPYGVIAVFTKKGQSSKRTDLPGPDYVKVKGYDISSRFNAPDYEDPGTDNNQADYRSTLYWNPSVWIDPKSGYAEVSFFASDLTGSYRVVAEGVDGNGKPIRCVGFVNVKN